MNISFTSIVYYPVFLAIAIIAFRYFKEAKAYKTHESFFFFLAFLFLALVCLTGALSGSLFRTAKGIRMMLILSSFLLTISNAFFAYIFVYSLRVRFSAWWGFAFILTFGFFVSLLTMQAPIKPVLEASGGVNWGMPLYISFLRSLIYILGIVPLAIVLFKELLTSHDKSNIRKNLILLIFFVFEITIVVFDFIIEPYLGLRAMLSEILILILTVIGMVIYSIMHERMLSRSERRFRRLVENMHDLVCLSDGKYVIQYANQSYKTILGYKPAQLKGKNFLDLVFQEDRKFVKGKLFGKNRETKSLSFEFRMLHDDQHPVWVESYGAFSLEEENQRTGVNNLAISSRDISERKLLENSLRQSQKMEAVGLLAGGIAHDFNNLLTVINGYSELILRKLEKDSPFYNKLVQIKDSGDRAASLTRQLLAFSRKQILKPEILDLNKLVFNMEKMLHRLIRENIQLNTNYDSSLKPVLADPGQMEQVILNLVVNARDSLPNGGRIIMETKNVRLNSNFQESTDVKNSKSFVLLSISDNGTGMDKHTLERIFEPFFTTKETGKGTGLGLSTVYGIIKQSQGDIQVQSQLGKGTVFKVYLPAFDNKEVQTVQHSVNSNLRGSETILLAEDDDAVRKLAKQGLQDFGYNVIEITSTEEAVAVAAKRIVHLLLSDVVMPDVSGQEIAGALQKAYPQIKILYMSGYTDNTIVHNGILDEKINFIQKPFSLISLAQKVREVLK